MLYKLDDRSVPKVHNSVLYNLTQPFNGYGMRTTMLRDLRWGSAADYQLLAKCYPSARRFVRRVLYLLGLLFISGIVHGASL